MTRFRSIAGIPRSLRRAIFRRDKFACVYCRKQLPATRLTLDHIHPVSKGGDDSKSNLATCCIECNNRKGDLSAVEYLCLMESQDASRKNKTPLPTPRTSEGEAIEVASATETESEETRTRT